MLNDPAIHGERITVSDNAKFILSSSNKNFSGAITLYYDWNNEEDKALATQYGFICDTRRCTWMLDGLKGLEMKYHSNRPVGQRVITLTLNGKPIED
ncbi:hypothetical protein AAIH07_34115, partial [Pseudomonas aeruginosa]